MIGGVFALSM
ncbi:BnaAnng19230D [Brassica napus]|uniref:BnaAnng19230D protein n=1 Tax=Brassica napus TaxID=3708 RepID=A0A078JF77_BRANA|nr:BnaAnng19230D [Brassica napus]